jgi:metal-responsive CopG/Arc/MetJ family transcriptional regulator
MTGKAVKVAITIPQEEYREVEAIRRRLGASRSSVILRALESWLAARRELALDRKYRAAYRRRPETKAEVEAQRALVSQMLASEEWEP